MTDESIRTVGDLLTDLEGRDPKKPIIIDMDGIRPTHIKEIESYEDAIVIQCEPPR